ncbi:MAG: transporter ATP-binding protein [Myxococcales bacterium]|nr:transporter ATP-binding protein [Myxococcales bacterium]
MKPPRLLARVAYLGETLKLVWRSSWTATLALGALTLFGSGLLLLVAYVGKSIVDAVVSGSRSGTLRWISIELGLVALQALVQRAQALVRLLLGARLSVDTNLLILRKAITLELHHFEDSHIYDQLSRARREASSRPASVVIELFQLVQNVVTLLGYVGLLLRFSGWALPLLIVAALPAMVAEMRFSAEAFRLRNRRSPEGRLLGYIEHVLGNDDHAKEVKLFNLGPLLLDRYRGLGERFYRQDRSLAVRRGVWGYSLSLIGTAGFYGSYLLMGLAAATGRITLGEMTLYVVAFRQGQQSFQGSLASLGDMYEHNLYMSNLFAFLAVPVPPAALPLAATRVTNEEGIRFQDVGFCYPGQEQWALRGINLFIPPGQNVAVVGHNGAGKTTLIKLLTGLYQPTEGRILLDGQDLRSWDPTALRRRLGVIFQDFNQYQFAAQENIGFGSHEHLDDRERVERAVARGGAAEVVASLPRGLETPLGRWFEGGVELSGGQWQRIALARAFMREEADILVLDEPTAALDAASEHLVFERFRTLARGRTAILISHRFATVRRSERIVVLEGGQVVEDGAHDQLVAAGARYAALFALQASGYQ